MLRGACVCVYTFWLPSSCHVNSYTATEALWQKTALLSGIEVRRSPHFLPVSLPVPQCVVRVCCIRSFGHFLTSLQGNVLHFNPEAGIFTSISQSEQDNLVQQAKAQFHMVSGGSVTDFYT